MDGVEEGTTSGATTTETGLFATGASEFIGLIHQTILNLLPENQVLVLLPDGHRSPGESDTVDPVKSLFPFPAQYLTLPLTEDALGLLQFSAQPVLPSFESEAQPSLVQTIHDSRLGLLCVYLVPNLDGPLGQRERARVELMRHYSPWVSALLSVLPIGARLLIFTTGSLLTYRQTDALRTQLLQEHTIEWLLEYEEEFAGFETREFIRYYSMVIRVGREAGSLTRMFRVPSHPDKTMDAILSDLERLGRQQGGRTAYGYVLRDGLPIHGLWGVEANDPAWRDRIADIGALGGTVPLASIADILHSRALPRDRGGAVITGGKRISGRDVSPDGHVDIMAGVRTQPAYEGDVLLSPGDILLRRAGRFDTQGLVGARVPDHLRVKLYADPSILVMRLHSSVSRQHQEILLTYLRSQRAARWLRAQKTRTTLHTGVLAELPVPVVDDDVVATLDQAEAVEQQLSSWLQELRDAKHQIFQLETVRAGRDNLVAASLRASQRVQAARAVETFSWRVRNLYPHPLAYRSRRIETTDVPATKYRAIIEAAEIWTCYLAIMGLVLSENYGEREPLGYLATITERLRRQPGHGLNFGDWLSLLENVSSGRRFRDLGPSTPFFELSGFLEQPGVGEALRRLSDRRNDEAHLRGMEEHELSVALAQAEHDLALLYEVSSFVTRYPLRYIVRATSLVRLNRIQYQFKDLIGDHPLVQTMTAIHTSGALQQDALYFAPSDGQLYIIHPWLVRLPCPRCGSMETYTFDKIDDGKVLVKSLERGHQINGEVLRADFQALGLLAAPR